MEHVAQRQLSRELLYMSDPERSGHAGGAGPLPIHLLVTDFGESAAQWLQQSLGGWRAHEAATGGTVPHSVRRPPIHYNRVNGTIDNEHDGERRPPPDCRQGTGEGNGPSSLGPPGRERRPREKHSGGSRNDFRANNEELLRILERPRIAEPRSDWQNQSKRGRGQLAPNTAADHADVAFRPRNEALMGLASIASAELFDLSCKPTTAISNQTVTNCVQDLNESRLAMQQATVSAGPYAAVQHLPATPRLTALPGVGRSKKSHLLTQGFHQTPDLPECPDEIDTNEPEVVTCTPDQAMLALGTDQVDRPPSSPDSTAPLMIAEEDAAHEDRQE